MHQQLLHRPLVHTRQRNEARSGTSNGTGGEVVGSVSCSQPVIHPHPYPGNLGVSLEKPGMLHHVAQNDPIGRLKRRKPLSEGLFLCGIHLLMRIQQFITPRFGKGARARLGKQTPNQLIG